MVATLLSLADKFVLTNGEVVYKEASLFRLIKKRVELETIGIQKTPETERFLLKSGKDLQLKEIDGDADGPPSESFSWEIPSEYDDIDLLDMCIDKLVSIGKSSEIYTTRLEAEFEQIKLKNMENFLKAVLFITDIFRANNVVFGLGRGSSCASLVLYLLDINKVDPVKYDISMFEFYK